MENNYRLVILLNMEENSLLNRLLRFTAKKAYNNTNTGKFNRFFIFLLRRLVLTNQKNR